MNYVFAVKQGDSLSLDVTTGSNPLQVTGVTTKWTNTTATTLTRLGSEVALGYAAGGPIGAAVVVIGGEAFGNKTTTTGKPSTEEAYIHTATWSDAVKQGFLCPGELTEEPKAQEKPSLLLPVAIDLDNSLPNQTPEHAGCWHRFPRGDKANTNQVWLYRVVDWTPADAGSVENPTVQLVPPVLDERKANSSADQLGIYPSDPTTGLLTPSDIEALAKDAPKEAWLVTSACHAVRLQVTHADEVISAARPVQVDFSTNAYRDQAAPSPHHDVKHFRDFDVVIADPRWNQAMRITEGNRTIAFGQCGGTSKGTVGSSEVADDVTAVAQFVKTVKGLQDSSAKSGDKASGK